MSFLTYVWIYVAIAVIIYYPILRWMFSGNEGVSRWGDFYLTVLVTIGICTLWILWLPFYLIHRGVKLIFGPTPNTAAQRITREHKQLTKGR